MMIFGTIGTVSRFTAVPSSVVSCIRAFAGTLMILMFLRITGRKPDTTAVRSNIRLLVIAGIFNGINWVLIFEGFRYTTVAAASLCYYMQPVFLMISAPFFFRERLSPRKVLCITAAFLGVALMTLTPGADLPDTHLRGIAFSLAAAVFYAANVIVSKKFKDISAYDSTTVQLLTAGIVLLPYIFLTQDLGSITLTGQDAAVILVLCIVHTGIAYIMYYESIGSIDAQTIAVLGYLDPVVSVLLSALILREGMTLGLAAGAVLILGASYISSRQQS